MENYKLEPIDDGLYEYQEDEFGRGQWMRVATYPPHLSSLQAVLNWYFDQTEED